MKGRLRVFVVGGFFLLAIVLPASITFYSDWLWFGETGYQAVFARSLAAQGTLGALAMAVAFVVLFVNLRIAMRMISPRQVVVHTREGPLAIAIDRHRMQPLSTAVAVGLAVLFGLFGSSQWQEWLLFRYAQPFGDVDPVLGRDVSFYVFRLPFLDLLNGYLLALVLLAVAISAWRRSPWLEGAATAATTLLFVDAWFDVLTSSTRAEFAIAITEALVVELPLAFLCLLLARDAERLLPRRS